MKFKRYLAWFMVYLAAVSLLACGKSSNSSDSSGTPATGAVTVKLTDAPGDFDHAFITVKDIWFHLSDSSGPQDSGWIKKPLDSPVTVDLLSLANGGLQTLWNGVTLAAGDYQQIRLVLADTDEPLTSSASTANKGTSLLFNNEVIVNGAEFPLQIPDARHGVRIAGHFKVVEGGTLTLALDFDAGHDIVEFDKGADYTEYVLKPRLRYFDLDNAGAIVGRLSTGQTFTRAPRFVIKAESLGNDGTYHIVNRWTVPNADGTFVLYPLSTATTSTYDVLIRGLNHQTVIIRGVPVSKGATPGSGPTDLGTISMSAAAAPDFVSGGSITSPTGAWVNFYQTLPGAGEVPYEVRFRHFHPITGNFAIYPLSNMPLLVGSYSNGTVGSFQTTTPQEGIGGYQVVGDAILYDRSAWSNIVSASSPTFAIPPLSVQSPWTGNTISGSITMNNAVKMNGVMDRGFLFVAHGGMIVSAINVDAQMGSGGAYSVPNIPGGTAAQPLPLAFYGVEAVGWQALFPRLHKAIAIPAIADVRTGDAAGVDMNMLPLW